MLLLSLERDDMLLFVLRQPHAYLIGAIYVHLLLSILNVLYLLLLQHMLVLVCHCREEPTASFLAGRISDIYLELDMIIYHYCDNF